MPRPARVDALQLADHLVHDPLHLVLVPFLLGHRRPLHLLPRRLGLLLRLARILHNLKELPGGGQGVLGASQPLRRPAPALFAVLVRGTHVVDPRGRLEGLNHVDVVEAEPIGGARARHLPGASPEILAVHGVETVALHDHLAPRREGRVAVADERILVRLSRRLLPLRLVVWEILLKRLRREHSRDPKHGNVPGSPVADRGAVANLRVKPRGRVRVDPLRLVPNREHVRGVVKRGSGVDLTQRGDDDALRDGEGRRSPGVRGALRHLRGVRAGYDVGHRDVRLDLGLARLPRLGLAEGCAEGFGSGLGALAPAAGRGDGLEAVVPDGLGARSEPDVLGVEVILRRRRKEGKAGQTGPWFPGCWFRARKILGADRRERRCLGS